jgi:hypothetical protein
MSIDEKKLAQPPDSRQIEEAIVLFEGILQASPEDQVALEALSLAYEQTGNHPLARATLIRLAHVIVGKQAYEAAAAVITRLKPLAEDDFDALEALRSLEALEGGARAVAVSSPSDTAKPILRSGVALRRQVLRREMDLAWNLLEANELTQEEYASVVEDLSRLTTSERHVTISLLHILSDRDFLGIDRVLHHLVQASQTPFLALESFTPQPVELGELSLEYLLRLGALPFAEMQGEPLVALLNPLDRALQGEIGALLGRTCHFYLVKAEAFDAAVSKLMVDVEA